MDFLWHPSAYLCIFLSSQNSKERLPGGQEGPRDGGAVGGTWLDLLARKMLSCWNRLLFHREVGGWPWEEGCRVISCGQKTCMPGSPRALALLTRSRSPLSRREQSDMVGLLLLARLPPEPC